MWTVLKLIPASATELTARVLRGGCNDALIDEISDVLHITIDGNDIGTLVCDETDADFVDHSFSIAPYNDGGVHTLNIGGTVGNELGHTNFFVDDVIIEDNIATPGMPSVCIEVVSDLACNSPMVTFDGGVPSS